jgi:hypothetical protein
MTSQMMETLGQRLWRLSSAASPPDRWHSHFCLPLSSLKVGRKLTLVSLLWKWAEKAAYSGMSNRYYWAFVLILRALTVPVPV